MANVDMAKFDLSPSAQKQAGRLRGLAMAARRAGKYSLHGLLCPYCAARGIYSELEYRHERADNICAACQEVLIAE